MQKNIDESFKQYYHIEKRPQKMNKNANKTFNFVNIINR